MTPLPTAQAELNFRWAWALLDGLVAAGMSRLALSPGARSTPLALAALRHPGLSVEVVLDERVAAFFALGQAKAGGAPVGVVATSGSAAANWFPAVVEADMARVPLILLSADRPPELHDRGANQTMDQIRLFGEHVRVFHQLPPAEGETAWLAAFAARLIARAQSPLAGPVHLNLPFREPLVPGEVAPPSPAPPPPAVLPGRRLATPEAIGVIARAISAAPGVIVCGCERLDAATRQAVIGLARRLAVPVLADALSEARFGGDDEDIVLAHPDAVVRAAPPPAWALRLGGMPVSRALADYLQSCRGAQIVVADHPRPADPIATATHLLEAEPGALCAELAGLDDVVPAPPGWAESFRALDVQAAAVAAAACAGAVFEGAVIRALVQGLPAQTPLFLGNSLAVRVGDWFAGRSPRPLRVFGNRGVSGIDGNLATAFGLASVLGPAVAVVGDLTFQHDVGALALGGRHPLAVVVLDNGGGGIFDHLPHAVLPEFQAGWRAPQAFDPAAAARAFKLADVGAADAGEVVAAVIQALDERRATVIHVPIASATSQALCQTLFAACRQGA